MEEFEKLGISDEVMRVIKEMGFEKPSEIQKKSIPAVLEGKDVIAGSATGSGKTLAFGLGIIKNTKNEGGIQALVLTPTRELAQQVAEAIKGFSKYKPMNVSCVYGGVSINPQIQSLMSARVVVGTPGRILDHMERKTINLAGVKTLVLDEADRMLDMGFLEDVERIIKACPKERQTLMFSATINYDVDRLSKVYMKNPVKVSAQNQVDPSKLKQIYYDVPDNAKFSLLVHLLQNEKSELVLVFCNTRSNVDFVEKNLNINGIKVLAIHGGFTQDKRNKAINDFHKNGIRVLVCTDVAGRGLDIEGISHVYNYDIPTESKDYIHRVGRTARAGSNGIAINILSKRDWISFSRVIKDYQLNIDKIELPNMSRAKIGWKGEPRRGRFSGPRRGRPSGRPRSSGPRHGGGYRSSGPRRGGSHWSGSNRSRSSHSSGR